MSRPLMTGVVDEGRYSRGDEPSDCSTLMAPADSASRRLRAICAASTRDRYGSGGTPGAFLGEGMTGRLEHPIGRPMVSEAPFSSVLTRVCLTSDRFDSGVQHQGAQPIRVLSVAARCALTMLDGSVVLPSAEGQCHRPGAGHPRQRRSPGKWARPRARHRMQPCTGKTRTPRRSLLQDGASVLASFPPRSGNADHPERRRVVACLLVVPVGGRSSAPLRSPRRVGGSVVRRWALWRHSLLRAI